MPVKTPKPMAWTNGAQTARFQAEMEKRARANLAKRLKELRDYKGWTADDLAHKSGVSIRTVSRLETAKIESPRESTLVRLAEALEESREGLAGPRLTPEQVDQATQTQLDRIETQLGRIVDLLAEQEIAKAAPPKRKRGSGPAKAVGE